MILLSILFVLLIVILALIFKKTNKDIFEPSFLFSFGFLALSFMALINCKKWSFDLHFNTFLVVFLGVSEFCIVCYFVKKYYVIKCKKNRLKKLNKLSQIQLPLYFEIAYLVLSIVACGIFLYYVVSSVGGNITSISSIISSIGKYDYLSKFTDNYNIVKLPFIVSNLRFAIIAVGYIFNYILVTNYFYNKKINKVEVAISIVAIISTFLDGSRTGAFYYAFAFIAMIFIVKNIKSNYKNNFSLNAFKKIIVVFLIFIVSFIPLAKVLGRDTKNVNFFDYISIYCGGQLKNLDMALQEGNFPRDSKIFGSQTFYTLNKTLGEKLKINNYEPYHLDAPFRTVNGYNLGNVYTTFYPYIYDFGYVGEFVFVLIMAIISQSLYETIKIKKKKNGLNIYILTYSFVASTLIMSFFSNKFYENVVSMVLVKYLLVWLFCIFCFEFYNNRKDLFLRHGKK
jgi:oligosaccharide repeat unit polymerase